MQSLDKCSVCRPKWCSWLWRAQRNSRARRCRLDRLQIKQRAEVLFASGKKLYAGSPTDVDNSCQTTQDCAMSRQTMSFALPDSMREYIVNRVSAGNYGNTSEYIRDLVRHDQEEQAKKRLRDLIEAGLASGPGRRRTKANEKELLAIARGEID